MLTLAFIIIATPFVACLLVAYVATKMLKYPLDAVLLELVCTIPVFMMADELKWVYVVNPAQPTAADGTVNMIPDHLHPVDAVEAYAWLLVPSLGFIALLRFVERRRKRKRSE